VFNKIHRVRSLTQLQTNSQFNSLKQSLLFASVSPFLTDTTIVPLLRHPPELSLPAPGQPNQLVTLTKELWTTQESQSSLARTTSFYHIAYIPVKGKMKKIAKFLKKIA